MLLAVRAATVMLLALGAAGAARAQEFPPVASRDFALDLYNGAVLGSIRTVGMGGAGVALVEKASGMGLNPAAPAVRAATSHDHVDWALALDWLSPDLGEDLDNNGDPDGDETSYSVVTFGGALQLGKLGLGLDFTVADRALGDDLYFITLITRILVAGSFADDTLALGLGLRGGTMNIDAGRGEMARDLVAVTAFSPSAGALWRPRDLDLRVGVTASLPVSADVPECDGCGERILPEKVRLPWEVSVGGAWRFAATRWNQQIAEEFRDERAVIVAADVLIVGAAGDTHGLQRWTVGELQPSGREVAVSVRAGVDFEWIPGWLRVRAGSYWEPGRLQGTGGRVHGAGGVEVRVFGFRLWGSAYRVRASLTLDGARDYANGGLSVGFW
jgi:hypothetical protein